MKRLITMLAFSFVITSAFGQLSIEVPDFAGADVKSFYQSYADHLIKCITAIREKNGTKVVALFKDPGEQLVAQEKVLGKQVIKDPVEKQKYMEFAKQVYPFIKELEQSEYYQKMYGNTSK